MVEACYTYQHGKAIKVGSDEDHVSCRDVFKLVIQAFQVKVEIKIKLLEPGKLEYKLELANLNT